MIAKEKRNAAKLVLTERFEKAIDRAAMRSGARDTGAYLAEWRRGEPVACGDDLDTAATAMAARLEAEFDDDRLAALVASGGREEG